jgi:hypothetical protein
MFSASPIFPTLRTIWAQMAAKRFLQNLCKVVALQNKKIIPSAPTLEQDLPIVTNFDPPKFSLDNTSKGAMDTVSNKA